ncbi:MAG: ABC transporter substrate-binding protein [Anaerolineae bacterium]
MDGKRLSRRGVLRLTGMTAAGAALAACGATPEPQVIKEVVTQVVEKEVTKIVEGTPQVVVETVVVRETVVAEPAKTYEEGELTILLCCSGPDEIAAKEEFNKRFAEKRPGVTVSMEPMPAGQNYFEKLQTIIAAGTAPDIYDMWEGYVQPYAKNGALMNLEPFMEKDTILKRDDFWPGALASVTYEGSLYSCLIAIMPGPVSLYYNKDLLDAAGVTYPTNNWTWDQMREAAKTLTIGAETGAPSQYGLVFDLWFVPWLYWIWSNHGDVFNADETKCTATEPPAYEALQYWADIVVKDLAAPTVSTQSTMQGASNMFQTGQVAMYLGNCWNLGELKAAREQGLNWGSRLAPTANDGNRTFYQHTWCWGIWTGTKKPNLAWEYCRDFVTEEEMMTAFNTFQKAFPAVKRMLHTFLTAETEELGWSGVVDIVGDVKKLRYPGAGAKWDKISTMFQAEIDLVFTGEKTAQDAMIAACPAVEEELARA